MKAYSEELEGKRETLRIYQVLKRAGQIELFQKTMLNFMKPKLESVETRLEVQETEMEEEIWRFLETFQHENVAKGIGILQE